MTIQDRIDEVVFQVQGVLLDAAIPDGDKERILSGVKELGFQWQSALAHGRALLILLGLINQYYPGHLKAQFIQECLELNQLDELERKESAGSSMAYRTIPKEMWMDLIDLLTVQQINGEAGLYAEKESDFSSVAQIMTSGYVQVVDRVPEVQQEAHTESAASVSVRKKKTGGAADGT